MRDLPHHARIGRVGDVDDAERHRRCPQVRQVHVPSLFEQLHAVTVTIKVVMTDDTHVPTFAVRLNFCG